MRNLLILLSIFLATSANFIGCKDKSSVAIAKAGYVNFIIGTVKLQGADNDLRVAKIGDEITQGTKIITEGKDSLVDIYFGLRAVKVYGDTVVTLSKMSSGQSGADTEFFVEKGRFFSNITKKLTKDEKYSVKTPTTVVGVRGTEFLVEESEGKSNVACLEGRVQVQDSQETGQVVIEEAQLARVSSGQAPVSETINEEQMNQLRQETIISDPKEEILNKFKEQRDEIRKIFKDKKEAFQKAVEEQKEKGKEEVKKQTEKDKENIKKVIEETNKKKEEINNPLEALKRKNKEMLENKKKSNQSGTTPAPQGEEEEN